MITRAEQKALFESVLGSLVINTRIDELGTDIVIPVHAHWGFEPKLEKPEDFPVIIMYFNIINQPIEKSLGDIMRVQDEGDFIGWIGGYSLLLKIKAVDFGSKESGNFISKIDITERLYKRIFELAIHNVWDSLIDDGAVDYDGITSATNVSQIFEDEQLYELQMTVKFRKLSGGIPNEDNLDYRFSTAPTILEVEHEINISEE